MNKVELLAPAGSLEILKAAVDAGADAVYLGLNVFNARMNAGNFSLDEISEGCNYAHLRSSKVYLTLNTLVNSYELDEALNAALDCYTAGVDGILIQDIGLASYIASKYPQIPLHASTQMNIYNESSLERLKSMNISRVVLPREMSLDEIKSFTKTANKLGIETEVFAHGAVCVCYSGLCLFSSMDKSGTRSGNRGQCAQPCRQEYKITDKDFVKEGHLLSPKDRSVVPYVKNLIESGVSSLKIEGRMRDVNYVTTVVSAYRMLIDAYYNNELDNSVEKKVKNMLLVNFNRGGSFTSQYLEGTKKANFLSGDFVGKFGLKLGSVTRCDKKSGGIEFSYDSKLPLPSKGDYISIREENKELFSFPVGKIHEAPNRLTVKGLHPDSIATIKGNPDVYLMSHVFYDPKKQGVRKTEISINFVSEEAGIISAEAKVLSGMNSEISASYELDYEINDEAKELSAERIVSQLSKTGDTPFKVVEVIISDSNPMPKCSVSLINELRRCLMDELTSEIIYSLERSIMPGFVAPVDNEDMEVNSGKVTTMYYFPTVKNVLKNMRRDSDIYAFSLYDMSYKVYKNEIINFIKQNERKFALVLPDACHNRTFNYAMNQIQELKSVLGDCFYAVIDSGVMFPFEFYKEIGVKHYISFGANIFNEKSLEVAAENSDAVSISLELTSDEIKNTLSLIPVDIRNGMTIILHSGGPVSWMQSDFCPLGAHKNNCGECFEHNCAKMVKTENNEKDTIIVSHSFDCSSTILGPAKFTMDNEIADDIADMGFNVIQYYSEV